MADWLSGAAHPRLNLSTSRSTATRTECMASTFPEWLVPMAATLTQERFRAPEWIFERKYDGIRALAFKQGREVRLLSRNRLPQHNSRVTAAIAALCARGAILDGELTWRDKDGRRSW